ncbi:hypothetical protein ED733_000872 [Metarhizium rileyi]|uniref:Uncharacterized protein n=1 Tax=Metarhizium rileyi (strain RCEF 4871) TaxID=1649241 RepID=A0A5C6G9J3_METRR|nr:hypothetical protein ED733_000872 [Metarhizium rileyi]
MGATAHNAAQTTQCSDLIDLVATKLDVDPSTWGYTGPKSCEAALSALPPAQISTTAGIKALEGADLRIASKHAYYDNNKPYGEYETVVLYIYNAGPDVAANPIAETAYALSLDGDAVKTTLRRASTWRQPSRDIKAGSLTWTDMPNPPSVNRGYILTHLPDIEPGTLLELSVSFPTTHEWSYVDSLKHAWVRSSTTSDPRTKNNMATYTITPNHHQDGAEYWQTHGDLSNLDVEELKAASPLEADLRIASARAHYNNDKPIKEGETLTFLVFNHGPAVATKPKLKAGYTSSMIGEKIRWHGEQIWVPEGVDPSSVLGSSAWQTLEDFGCGIDDEENVLCGLPDLPPQWLYRIKISFPMNHVTSYSDYDGTATISSETAGGDEAKKSTSYWITPNHDKDGEKYWAQPGHIAQLDGAPVPLQSRTACSTGWLVDTPVMVSDSTSTCRVNLSLARLEGWTRAKGNQITSYDFLKRASTPEVAAEVKHGQSSKVTVLSFSADNLHEQSYGAHPDTLVYLDPTTLKVGRNEVRLGYWIPVRMLWAGAAIRAMNSDGNLTSAQVTRVETQEAEYSTAQPLMVSQSHSYWVGTSEAGSILTHDQGDQRLCNGQRPSTPADLPRRDEEGNWLIYLHEDANPAAVENARYAVNEAGRPWKLTYDPAGERRLLSESMLSNPSHTEFLELSRRNRTTTSGVGHLVREQYPPAIAMEGYTDTIVAYISPGFRSARSMMEQQFDNYRADPQPDGHAPIAPGNRFRIAIVHSNVDTIEYLGHHLVPATSIERPPLPR